MDYCYHCMAEIESPENPYCPECGEEHNVHYSQSFELPAGTYLCDNRYFVGKSLGSGGFGITYLGYDTRVKKKIVIKETFYNGVFRRNSQNITLRDPLKVEYDSDISLDEIMSKTQKECYCLSKAESFNNIVRVYDWFAENNTAYIITEYINGDTLFDRVAKTGAYSWNDVYKKFKPLLLSLAQLHKMGLLHRDIKPHNIMIREVFAGREDFVLIDFGLARSTKKATMVATMAAFTPGFSPFEQRTLSKKDGTYTDVYAVAATMYYALTGETPNDEIVGDVLDNFPKLNSLKTSGVFSESVYRAFVNALQPNFKHRCQTVDEFLEALDGEDLFSTPVESPYNRSSFDSRDTRLASGASPLDPDDFFGGGSPTNPPRQTGYAVTQNRPSQEYVSIPTRPTQPQQSQTPIYVNVEQPKERKHHGALNAVLCLCIALLAVLSVVLLNALEIIDVFPNIGEESDSSYSESVNSYYLEDYTGKDFESVQRKLEKNGFEVRHSLKYNTGAEEGTIISQDKDPGNYNPSQTTVKFDVAAEEEDEKVSNVTSNSETSAASNLSASSEPPESVVTSAADSKPESSPAVISSPDTESAPSPVVTSNPAPVAESQPDRVTDEKWQAAMDRAFDYSGLMITENNPVDLRIPGNKPVFNSIHVTSTLPSEGVYSYVKENAMFYNGACWTENAEGVGEGEYFEYYNNNNKEVTVSQCKIVNGYVTNNPQVFYDNGRMSVVTFEFSDGSRYTYLIDPNTMAEQTIRFPRQIQTSYIKVIIERAVPGNKYYDTCISTIVPE